MKKFMLLYVWWIVGVIMGTFTALATGESFPMCIARIIFIVIFDTLVYFILRRFLPFMKEVETSFGDNDE